MTTYRAFSGYRTRFEYDTKEKCFVHRREIDPFESASEPIVESSEKEMLASSSKKQRRADAP
jgi:hypothetical protein